MPCYSISELVSLQSKTHYICCSGLKSKQSIIGPFIPGSRGYCCCPDEIRHIPQTQLGSWLI